MKSKEEIEQLAEEFLSFHQEGSKVYHIKIREAIAFAYTQCKEDMAKEIEELKKTERHLAYQTSVYLDEMNKLKSHKNENIT